MKPNTPAERLYNGIIKENPTFVLMLGMCPTLAITTSATNGIGMGLTTTVILAASNLMISLLRNFIPDRVRMPAFIVVVASFVTVVQLLLQGFIPSLYDSLGIYIPLIVVNCIILGRAEAYASKNKPIASLFDGIGMGLGFTLSITCIGAVRELIGAGSLFGHQILPLADAAAGKAGYEPITIFILAPGAFFVLAALSALQNKFKIGAAKRGIDPSNPDCGGSCAACGNTMCKGKRGYWIMKELLIILVSSAIVNNVVLSQFLGLCPFLGVSKSVETAAGMGGAIIFVITLSSFVTGIIYNAILVPTNLTYLQTIVFILLIAALVQFVEMFLKKTMPSLYQALGVYLPLITTNCAVLGVALTNVQKEYNVLQGTVNGFATAVGFTISIVLMAGIREKIAYNDIPKSFQGFPTVLLTAGLMAIAFFGFSGLI